VDKFYVTFGEFQLVVVARTPVDACIATFKAFLKKDENGGAIDLPLFFRLSGRGFDKHHDDKEVKTKQVVSIMDKERPND
jgi:hypothetical protein